VKRAIRALSIIILAAVLSVILAKDIAGKWYLSRIIRQRTGVRLSMEGFRLGLLNTDIEIKDLVIMNPRAFPDRVMADIPRVYINFDTPALMKKRAHFKEIDLELDEFVIIKDKGGKLNISSLKALRSNAKNGGGPEDKPVIPISINDFKLKIRKVVYKEYTSAGAPSVREFNINLHERFENIEDAFPFTRIILVEAIKKAALEQILNVDLGLIGKPVSGALKAAKQVTGSTVNAVSGTATKTSEAIKNTTRGLQKMIQGESSKSPALKNPENE
jgi:uncharacterized protein involved in outer membrane biogenesis